MDEKIIKLLAGHNETIPIEIRDPADDSAVDISTLTDIQFVVKDKNNKIVINKTYVDSEITLTDSGVGGNFEIIIEEGDTKNLDGVYQYDLTLIFGTDIIPVYHSLFIVEKGLKL